MQNIVIALGGNALQELQFIRQHTAVARVHRASVAAVHAGVARTALLFVQTGRGGEVDMTPGFGGMGGVGNQRAGNQHASGEQGVASGAHSVLRGVQKASDSASR